jgi:hypothetical protein
MISLRNLLRWLPVVLALFFAAAPAVAERSHFDVAIAANDGTSQGAAHFPKLADHASKKPRPSATLEEFFEIDDDAEQHFKPRPLLAHDARSVRIGSRILVPPRCIALRTHRVCAAFPTGPPHA